MRKGKNTSLVTQMGIMQTAGREIEKWSNWGKDKRQGRLRINNWVLWMQTVSLSHLSCSQNEDVRLEQICCHSSYKENRITDGNFKNVLCLKIRGTTIQAVLIYLWKACLNMCVFTIACLYTYIFTTSRTHILSPHTTHVLTNPFPICRT